jgi:hypothetical protein
MNSNLNIIKYLAPCILEKDFETFKFECNGCNITLTIEGGKE